MIPRFARGKFSPKNAEKYVGTKTPTYQVELGTRFHEIV
jgi:hypothetical protein